MAALTLTTALANASDVFLNKKATHCLDQNFQVVTDLKSRATFDELMAKASSFPEKVEEATKNRLIVILRLLYSTPKDVEPKVQVKKALSSLEEKKKGKKELEEALFAEVETPAIKTPELQKQTELSLLLLGYDLVYMQHQWATAKHKLLTILKNIEEYDSPLFSTLINPTGKDSIAQLDPNQISNPIYSAFLFRWAKLFDPKTYILNITRLSYLEYQEFCLLCSHPDPEMSKICKLIRGLKEVDIEHNKVVDRESFLAGNRLHAQLCTDPEYDAFYKAHLPQALDLFGPISNVGDKEDHIPGLKRIVENCVQSEKQFFADYERIYRELHQIQKERYASLKAKKEFLKKFNCRLYPCHIPGKGVIDTFPTPEQLRSELSLPKEIFGIKKKKKKTGTSKQEPLATTKPPELASEKPVISSIVEKRKLPFDKVAYDKRVLEWFDKREEAPSGYTPEDAVWKHAFTQIVDMFIGTSYSFSDTWKNEKTGNDDPCFCILADITFPSKLTVSGVFQFTFDKNWVCYHRWFGQMSNIERLDKVISQKRKEIDFPALGKPKKPTLEEIDSTQFSIDPFFGSITFKDPVNGLIIKIYKVEG